MIARIMALVFLLSLIAVTVLWRVQIAERDKQIEALKDNLNGLGQRFAEVVGPMRLEDE